MIRARMRRVAVLVASASLVASTVGVGVEVTSAPPAEAAQKVRVVKAIRQLDVKAETPSGYSRSAFRHWIDANRDGQDTRAEVLMQESKTRVQLSGGTVVRGKWRSYYDGRVWRNASDVDVDHLVPLKEAWDSGARRWTAGTRKRFANDLGDRRSLVAVTDNVNQAKGADDPAEWMPRKGKCRYTKEWVAVKSRWDLAVDRAEKRTLIRQAKKCGNPRITIKDARVVTQRSGGGSTGGGTTGGSYPPVSTWTCPSYAPIKGNEGSWIYHPPSSPWYAATTPEQCFATEAAARDAGFRRANY